MDTTDFENDIPLDLARAAHSGTSFVPEDRAAQERRGYASTLRSDYEALARLATTPDKQATLEVEFARYRANYRTHVLGYLQSRSRCMSTMITGASNFPVRRQQRLGAISDARTQRMIDYRERALAAIRRALTPELQPVRLGEHDAGDRYKAKLEALEAKQAMMKACNAAIRKHAKKGPEAQIAALVALGATPGHAAELLKPDWCGRVGFADYETKNNGAEIRRLKSRITLVERTATIEPSEVVGALARIEDCPADNRVRVFFPGKPDVATRTALKSAGFRWTPSLGCWQAYRHEHTIQTAHRFAGVAEAAE